MTALAKPIRTLVAHLVGRPEDWDAWHVLHDAWASRADPRAGLLQRELAVHDAGRALSDWDAYVRTHLGDLLRGCSFYERALRLWLAEVWRFLHAPWNRE
ncbi:MAG: hypothetical protein AAF602_16085, partial [Myxococcota bacterium]